MNAKLKTINRMTLLTAEEAMKRIFAMVDSPALKAQLSKWQDFGLSEAAGDLHTLSAEELGDFMDRLPDLVLALYAYQKEIQKGGDK
ncbi:hypothetical protein [Mucilaginibacter rubeus]|uniref:Uncharacterized protein n=1 Tax=Mucilaginibacter rubeus TaxID=2027860 RepID=A0A5C1I4W8_9SPHI|nr:hypothetical protein [Mucilaginibacter rubeus]QEM12370.1 hypothetical protein DEO27_020900 [Mucilaginibacter rubeus]